MARARWRLAAGIVGVATLVAAPLAGQQARSAAAGVLLAVIVPAPPATSFRLPVSALDGAFARDQRDTLLLDPRLGAVRVRVRAPQAGSGDPLRPLVQVFWQ